MMPVHVGGRFWALADAAKLHSHHPGHFPDRIPWLHGFTVVSVCVLFIARDHEGDESNLALALPSRYGFTNEKEIVQFRILNNIFTQSTNVGPASWIGILWPRASTIHDTREAPNGVQERLRKDGT